ncbi:hypothetical protein INR49_020447, partial [Caranx melampygus]
HDPVNDPANAEHSSEKDDCKNSEGKTCAKEKADHTLINDRHNTFFHRNCPGSTKTRHLMDGVAEIAWYCPAGKPNDAFTDCTAFCNLHVSAGRCTKGAFMQLVKVSEEMKTELKFDYVWWYTEGLRALELAGNTTLHRDNELATFVVGLGNMT